MARATIHDAAGDTKIFLYTTNFPDVVSETASKLTLNAKILSGPFRGETAIIEWFGSFDLAQGVGFIEEWRESVDGSRHFTLKLDGPVDIEELLSGGFSEPLVFRGNSFDNVMEGDRTADRLFGNDGADELIGARGNDKLDGGAGRDDLAGGRGRDTLLGGLGKDLLAGGAQADVFAFHSARDAGEDAKADVLSDFAAGVDRIDLRRIDADAASDADDAFAFIGDAAFSGAGGEVRYANGRLSGDIVGGGGAEFQIEIANGVVLTVDDLIL